MLEKLLFAGLKIANTPDQPNPKAIFEQSLLLQKLLKTARKTAFGSHHRFSKVLKERDLLGVVVCSTPPV